MISYLLGCLVDESRMAYRPRDFYEKHKVETTSGGRGHAGQPRERVIFLAGGVRWPTIAA